MFQLPISRLCITIRQPTGREDLMLQELPSSGIAAALEFVSGLAETTDGERVDWMKLTVTDLEAMLLVLRQSMLGNSVRAETRCVREECGERVDVSFRVDEYMARQKPRLPRGIERLDEPGWFCFTGEPVKFRLPVCSDLLTIQPLTKRPDEVRRRLAGQCIDVAEVTERLRKRIERAMQALAAPLSGNLEGRCPECGSTLSIYFDVVAFVLREMRDHAATVYQDVHLLALLYKWPEEKILELPRNRRLHYAEMIRGERAVA